MEHGGLDEVDSLVVEAEHDGDVIQVEHLGSVVDQNTFGQSSRSAGVHEDDRIFFFGFFGHRGVGAVDQFLVAEVVGNVTLADQHDAADTVRFFG